MALGLLAAAGAIMRARSLPEGPEAAPTGTPDEAATAAAADRAGRVVRREEERAGTRSERSGSTTR